MAELPASAGCQETPRKTYTQIMRVDAMKWTEPDYTRRGETPPTDADAANRRQFEVLIPMRDWPSSVYLARTYIRLNFFAETAYPSAPFFWLKTR